MKKRDMFEKLNREFDEITPGPDERVKSAPICAVPESPEKEKTLTKRPCPSFFSSWKRVAALASALVLTVGVIAGVLIIAPRLGPDPDVPPTYLYGDTYLTVNINPAVSIIADSDGKVVSVTTKNRDAEILLSRTDRQNQLIGQTYGYVVNYITGEALALGYLSDTNNLMSVSGVSAGGDEKTAKVLADVKSSAEKLLSEKNVSATVSVSAADKTALLAEAKRVSSSVTDDDEIEDIIETLTEDRDYIHYFSDEIESVFGENADQSVKTLYRLEILEEYVETLEDRQEFLEEIKEFHDELAEDDSVNEIFDAYTETPGGDKFSAPDGWWAYWYSKVSPSEEEYTQDLAEYAEDFEELFEDYDELGFEGMELLMSGGKPNAGAYAVFTREYARYGELDFDELGDYVEQLGDLYEELSEAELSALVSSFDSLLSDTLSSFVEDWDTFAANKGDVGGVEDYVEKAKRSFENLYDLLKKSASSAVV